MVDLKELRTGNLVLYKNQHKITKVEIDHSHLDILIKGGSDLFYPIKLKAETLQAAGFTENEKYALLPGAHEFILQLPIPGSHQCEILAYIKNNGECFCRGAVNRQPSSHTFYNLHQLQNYYYAVTGNEMEIKKEKIKL